MKNRTNKRGTNKNERLNVKRGTDKKKKHKDTKKENKQLDQPSVQEGTNNDRKKGEVSESFKYYI